jgi:hypothetical protein
MSASAIPYQPTPTFLPAYILIKGSHSRQLFFGGLIDTNPAPEGEA